MCHYNLEVASAQRCARQSSFVPLASIGKLSFLHSHLERRCNRRNIVQFGVQYSSVPIFHSHSWDRYALYTMHDHLDVLLFLICMFEQRCPGWWNSITLALLPRKHFKTCFVHGKRCRSPVGHDDYTKFQCTLCPGHRWQKVFRSKEQTYLSHHQIFPMLFAYFLHERLIPCHNQ